MQVGTKDSGGSRKFSCSTAWEHDSEAEKVGEPRLQDPSGVKGTDQDSLQLGRRGFAVTKRALDFVLKRSRATLAPRFGAWERPGQIRPSRRPLPGPAGRR